MLIGYARVSKADGSQSLDLQRAALRAEGIDEAANLYHDFASGVRDDRPGLDSCVRALRKGDVLVVWKLDRLGRPRSPGAGGRPDRATARKRQQRRPHQSSASDSTNRPGPPALGQILGLLQKSGGRRRHQIMPDALRFPVLIVAGFGASPVWNAPGQPPCLPMTSSILVIRRRVSVRAATIFR